MFEILADEKFERGFVLAVLTCTVISILIFATLGKSVSVSPLQMEEVVYACSGNGGLKNIEITRYMFSLEGTAYCENGNVVTVDLDKVKEK